MCIRQFDGVIAFIAASLSRYNYPDPSYGPRASAHYISEVHSGKRCMFPFKDESGNDIIAIVTPVDKESLTVIHEAIILFLDVNNRVN